MPRTPTTQQVKEALAAVNSFIVVSSGIKRFPEHYNEERAAFYRDEAHRLLSEHFSGNPGELTQAGWPPRIGMLAQSVIKYLEGYRHVESLGAIGDEIAYLLPIFLRDMHETLHFLRGVDYANARHEQETRAGPSPGKDYVYSSQTKVLLFLGGKCPNNAKFLERSQDQGVLDFVRTPGGRAAWVKFRDPTKQAQFRDWSEEREAQDRDRSVVRERKRTDALILRLASIIRTS